MLLDNRPATQAISGTARTFAAVGAVTALLAVAAGAFGAHALRDIVPAERIDTFETAARYQMYHALALFAVAWLAERLPGRRVEIAGWLFLAGMLVFSGSLYALTLTGIRILGAITPIGGVLFLAGWATLAWMLLRPPTPLE